MPRRIIRQWTDRTTGETRVDVEIADDASFAERLLAGFTADGTKYRAAFARVVCDGCGARQEISLDDPQIPPGWVSVPDGEFCPACAN